MKIVIFGATQGVGRKLVDLALSRNHHVTAFGRSASGLDIQHENLRVVQGDVFDAAAVEAAVAGQDVVMCALGAPALRSTRIRELGTQAVIDAMKKTGVERLLCVSVLGVGDSRGNLTFFLKHLLFPLYLRKAVADHERQEAAVRASGLAWTIVRPPTLTDGPATGAYQHGFGADDGPFALKVARADVANFMLDQMARPTYVGRTPAISY
ncbi:MAG: SDR family oxidoreductase [Myxococcota bacterium]